MESKETAMKKACDAFNSYVSRADIGYAEAKRSFEALVKVGANDALMEEVARMKKKEDMECRKT